MSRLLTPTLAVLAAIVSVLVAQRVVAVSRVRELPRAHPASPSPSPTSAVPGPSEASSTTPNLHDVSAASGLAAFVHERGGEGDYWIPELLGSGGALLDHDGDGDLDVYLVQGGPLRGATSAYRNRLFRNDGGLRFVDVSAGSGADVPGHGMGAAAADVDDDGDIDVYVTRIGSNVLLANDGAGRFGDVSAAAGVDDVGYGTSAAFFDLDNDGLLDLYVVNYVEWSPAIEQPCYSLAGVRDYCNPTTYPPQPDKLYRNLGDGRFADVTARSSVGALARDGLAVLATDFDDDGFVDVYVANDQMPAFLWHNAGDGTLQESAMLAGCAFNEHGLAIAGMGLVSEDLDADGDFDLLVTNILDQSHLALRNDGSPSNGGAPNQAARFDDVSRAWGLTRWSVPFTGWGVALFDQDNDGALDLFVANGHVNHAQEPLREDDPFGQPNQLARQGADGRFVPVPAGSEPALAAIAVSRAVLVGDLDDDGDLDLLVTNNGSTPQLLANQADPAHAWTSVAVRRRPGGADVFGARVIIEAGGRRWLREVRPQVGYLGSNDPRVHVGLGAATSIDRLSVRWPDGQVDEARDLPVRRHLAIVREPQFVVDVVDD